MAVLVALIGTDATITLRNVNNIFWELIGMIDIVGYLLRLKHVGVRRPILRLLDDKMLMLQIEAHFFKGLVPGLGSLHIRLL